jgi:hypothetical protein
MESLLSATYLNSTFEDGFKTINLDISCLNESVISEENIDISKATTLELSDLIVSGMLKHIKKDLSSIRVPNSTKS